MKTWKILLETAKDGGLTKRYLKRVLETGETVLTDNVNEAAEYKSYSVAKAALDYVAIEWGGGTWICNLIES